MLKNTFCFLAFAAVALGAVGCSQGSEEESIVESSDALTGTIYRRVLCESWDYRYAECSVDTQGGRILSVRVARQISRPPGYCDEGRSFGIVGDNRIWVDEGCRAELEVRIQRSTLPNCGVLAPGAVLRQNQSVTSCDGRNVFVHQGDGHVVLYHDGRALWWTGVVDSSSRDLVMQHDGNLVQYDRRSRPMWASDTSSNNGAWLNVQDDCNVVIYDRDLRALWDTQTHGCVEH